MKVFIGSSGRKKVTADKIATHLETVGFTVLRWWDEKVFRPGDYTMARLIEVSKLCDAAVMIFGADDHISWKKGVATKFTMKAPRDNVVLEYGLFAGQVGMDRTLIVADKKIKVPTDLEGITIPQKGDFLKSISDKLKKALGQPSYYTNNITIHTTKTFLRSLRKQESHPSWISRALYLGSLGADLWESVESDHDYLNSRGFDETKRSLVQLIKSSVTKNFDCVFSFGPGVATIDREIIYHIRGENTLSYIPIDINPYLAFRAAENVDQSSSEVGSPFCIIGDFEDGMDDIGKVVHSYTSPGRVFLMLGGTFGNLEKTEDGFLNGLHGCMEDDDIAILDVFTALPNYSFNNDPLIPLSKQPKAVRRYLSGPFATKYGESDIDKFAADIDQYLEVVKHGRSSIDGTVTLSIIEKSKKTPFIYIRRYEYSSFSSHIENLGFEIMAKKQLGRSNVNPVGRGLFIIRRKRPTKRST